MLQVHVGTGKGFYGLGGGDRNSAIGAVPVHGFPASGLPDTPPCRLGCNLQSSEPVVPWEPIRLNALYATAETGVLS